MIETLECIHCHKHTTRNEADYRIYRSGFCGYCGYVLELVTDEILALGYCSTCKETVDIDNHEYVSNHQG